MTNPDLNGLFDDWQKGTVLLVAWYGGAAQGHLQTVVDGVLTLSGPNLTVFIGGTPVEVPGPVNINVDDVIAVAFVSSM